MRTSVDIGHRYEWRDFPAEPIGQWEPHPDYADVRVKMLVNPTGAEHRDEVKARAGDNDEYLAHIAPRIVDWNLTSGGEKVPPPADDPDILMQIPEPLLIGVILMVQRAHLPKARPREKPTPVPSAGTTAPPIQETAD